MLSNEQALAIIKQHDECYVVWATDQNAIVAVHPIPKGAKTEDRFAALSNMKFDYSGPKKGRFLSSSTTSLQTLLDEAHETDRVAERVRIFNSWEQLRNDELLTILGSADFPEPMDAFHGSNHIVKRLYKIRGPTLSGLQMNGFREFALSTPSHPDQTHAQFDAQCYLAVLMKAPSDLVRFWQKHLNSHGIWSCWSAFCSAAGDLAVDEPGIIEQFIEVLTKPGMFGPKFRAMVALGKIGSAAGRRGAQVIKESVYDSSAEVVASRDRALLRIGSGPDEWETCPDCYHGYVNGRSHSIPSIQSCTHCLGFGYTPRHA
jgi:hypothetical protein